MCAGTRSYGARERFNDVIEKALKESKCVVVMWSKRSMESQYVRDEAAYALNRNNQLDHGPAVLALGPSSFAEISLVTKFDKFAQLREPFQYCRYTDFKDIRRYIDWHDSWCLNDLI